VNKYLALQRFIIETQNNVLSPVNVGSYLPECNHALLRTHAASLDHDEIVVNFTIMRKATHRRDTFVSKIILRRSIILYDLQMQKDIMMNINILINNFK